MGGHAGGDVAASLAVERFGAAFRQADSQNVAVRLERGLDTANAAIADRIAEDLNLEGMGCTVVGVWMVADQLGFISVGDSPLWCLLASSGGSMTAKTNTLGPEGEQCSGPHYIHRAKGQRG